MLNLFNSAEFLVEKGAFINEPITTGEVQEPLFFYLMKNNPSLMFSTMFSTLLDKADLKLIKKFRFVKDLCFQPSSAHVFRGVPQARSASNFFLPQPSSVCGWTLAFLPAVHRLCGAIEGIEPFFATPAQDGLAEGDQPRKNPLKDWPN